MRSSWTALRRGFVRKFSTRQARAAIESLARRHPELARFDTPESVIAHCHGTPIEVADRVIARLTRCVQQGDHVDFASTALWLALWPGLTGIYDRRIRHFDRQPRELVSSLALAFSRNVHGLNHASVRHVACALVRGTERDLMSERQLEWSRTKHWSTHTGLDEETGWPEPCSPERRWPRLAAGGRGQPGAR